MGGTLEGGLKASKTNKARHGQNFYAEIGAKGGAAGTTGGFYGDYERASAAGRIGGKVGSRGAQKAPLDVRRKKAGLKPKKVSWWDKTRKDVYAKYLKD